MNIIRHDIDPPLTCHVHLQECWVCHEAFFDRGGQNPSFVSHVHHIVPQAGGGKEGPTVTICTHHHDLLHRIAESWMAQKNHSGRTLGPLIGRGLEMLNTLPDQNQLVRLRYLASVVALSLHLTKDDPNKPVFVTVTLTKTEADDLDRLAKVLRAPNRGAALKESFQQVLKSRFPLRKE